MRSGDQVYKPESFEFPGVVMSTFRNLLGEKQIVVESLRTPGLLHIFTEEQMEQTPLQQPCGDCKHPWYNHERTIRMKDAAEVIECGAYTGMERWCGCKNTIPPEIRAEQAEVYK